MSPHSVLVCHNNKKIKNRTDTVWVTANVDEIDWCISAPVHYSMLGVDLFKDDAILSRQEPPELEVLPFHLYAIISACK